jgi:hypothetical protein
LPAALYATATGADLYRDSARQQNVEPALRPRLLLLANR